MSFLHAVRDFLIAHPKIALALGTLVTALGAWLTGLAEPSILVP